MSISADVMGYQRLRSLPTPERRQLSAYVAMLVTVLIWAGFALTTRASGASALAFGDIAFLRALVPSLIFLPFLPSRIGMIRQAGIGNCTAMTVGAGVPFFWLAILGGSVTSAAHVGALIAGVVPIFVAGLSWLMTGVKPSRQAICALAIIFLGALFLIAPAGAQSHWMGVCALLLASLLWASYTIAMKRSRLDPIACGIVIALPSFGLITILLLTGIVASNWGNYTVAQALPFVLIQGIAVGVVASLTYAFAISQLSAGRCATLGSVAPALTVLLAVPVLNESLTLLTALAVITICAGVILFNKRRNLP
ncbi:DMT family transporter [Granulosicoccus antarcticus]|uniref:EamA domain-containing protein n=1 Tax=Granulosicoccus antarcticus IMCC3135 TaxID=1192854 RepID=A0A2Z2NL36_9GAMM|nr:DMT family transporter [Granulosicoccus antarcticus]ASJ72036.1 hypothetical protein IMCC3135_09700 [Granulosicoccus antarcticus IMCC3135]